MSIMRKVVRLLSNFASARAETYGEIAEMHAGPCERCVGYAVTGVSANPE